MLVLSQFSARLACSSSPVALNILVFMAVRPFNQLENGTNLVCSQESFAGQTAQQPAFVANDDVPDVWRKLYNRTPPAAYKPLLQADSSLASSRAHESSPGRKPVKVHASFLITPSRVSLPASAASAAALLPSELRQFVIPVCPVPGPTGSPQGRHGVPVPKADKMEAKVSESPKYVRCHEC
jgi:hypothetical protein